VKLSRGRLIQIKKFFFLNIPIACLNKLEPAQIKVINISFIMTINQSSPSFIITLMASSTMLE